jgi:hypothetical protein
MSDTRISYVTRYRDEFHMFQQLSLEIRPSVCFRVWFFLQPT